MLTEAQPSGNSSPKAQVCCKSVANRRLGLTHLSHLPVTTATGRSVYPILEIEQCPLAFQTLGLMTAGPLVLQLLGDSLAYNPNEDVRASPQRPAKSQE